MIREINKFYIMRFLGLVYCKVRKEIAMKLFTTSSSGKYAITRPFYHLSTKYRRS